MKFKANGNSEKSMVKVYLVKCKLGQIAIQKNKTDTQCYFEIIKIRVNSNW